MRVPIVLAGFVSAVSAATAADTISTDELEFFEKKVRPILAESCYKCHSVEEGKSRGGLTLDTREGVMKGGEGGAALVPGDAEKSLLIQAVRYEDKDTQMPPNKDGGKKLSDAQIAVLTEWVKMGAPDPRTASAVKKLTGLTKSAREHWSFQPVKKPTVPAVKNRAWCATPVDAFILEKIESKGMSPSPMADKETLLRRATYNLIGLPPSPQEIEDFLKDESPYAFSKVVDRLLASPHYGERWGRHWLNTARYSDTAGERAVNRNADYRFPYAWTYRDYVVRSFNEDKPYDRFIIEQLAADRLTDLKDPSDLAALGFVTVGARKNNVNEIIDDRIDAVTRGFLGMTVSCARCHDHKFDPIPTQDYYALHGIFSSSYEPQELPVINTVAKSASKDFTKQLKELEDKNLSHYYDQVAKTNSLFRQKAAAYLKAAYLGRRGASDAEQLQSIEVKSSEKLNNETSQALATAIRRDRALFGPIIAFEEGRWSEIAEGRDKRLLPRVADLFKGQSVTSFDQIASAYGTLFSSLDADSKRFIERMHTGSEAGGKPSEADSSVAQLVSTPLRILPAADLDTESLRKVVASWPLALSGSREWVFASINQLKLTHTGSESRAMVVRDLATPVDSPVFIRGQAQEKGEIVPRRFLEVLSGGKPKPYRIGSGRFELAQSIADKQNPLTARVMVNRVWLNHFGEGFVRTPDDLGTMAEKPTHPELLDYLSGYFMENGWSLKKLHKLIMLSRVYQESSYTVPAHEQIDPENRLLWRANVRRLDFEATRDSLLTFSGKLEKVMGGHPVNLTDEPYSMRRSVYGYVDRGNLPELMAHFDFSNPEAPNSKRSTTIVPQQALFLMNSPMVVDVARSILARPEVLNSRDNLNRVFNIYRIVLGRAPKPAEINYALEFIGKESKLQPEVLASAKEMTDKQSKKSAERLKRMESQNNDALAAIRNDGKMIERKPLTAWETCIHALLLSNEVVYVN
jgi:cytochrome c553